MWFLLHLFGDAAGAFAGRRRARRLVDVIDSTPKAERTVFGLLIIIPLLTIGLCALIVAAVVAWTRYIGW